MSQRCLRRLIGTLALLTLGVCPTTWAAAGVPGGYAGIWRNLCPLIADGHGFVDAAAWRSMLQLPAGQAPRQIDHWTSVDTVSVNENPEWGARLQTSRYEAGKTSAWIDDPRLNLKDGYRSELSITGKDPGGPLPLARIERTMATLGFRKIGNIDPYGRDGEVVFVRMADTNERLNVRYQKGPETTPNVSGLTLVGYQRNNHWSLPHVEGACDP